MASTRDYYEVLGVSKGASDQELKQAYRKQAMQWHPDRHQGDKKAAEEKFKEINAAYEVLSDQQKKAAYDQYGHAAFQQGGFGSAQGPNVRQGQAGQYGPFTYSYSSSGGSPFEGADFGGFSDPFEIFESFFGGGGSPFGRRQARKPVYSLQIEFMDAVKGVSKDVDIEGKRKTIKIPAGVDEGTRIRFDDFDVVVSVRPHKTFKREGHDIYTDVSLSFADAALGTVIEVETIDEVVKLKIAPGVQPNTLMRLRGKGVTLVRGGGRGDHYVRLIVTVPTRLNRQQRELLEQLKNLD